jgi:hypothetical protein
MKITKDQAEKLLKTLPEFAEQIYLDYPELNPSKIVGSWEDLDKISGYFIDDNSEIHESVQSDNCKENKDIFKTEKQAESSLAYSQLTQLMADCGDCDVHWYSFDTKYCIQRSNNLLEVTRLCKTFDFLAFKTPEIALEFIKKHEGLIKQFYQL